MALRIELEGDKPGIAKLIIQKWQGDADIDILVQRNQDGYYLANDNQWTAETHWHNIPNLTLTDGKLEGIVTNWLVDALLSQESRVRFLITVRPHQEGNQSPSYTDRGAVNIAENVLASSALDTPVRTESSATSTPPTATPVIEESELDIAPVENQENDAALIVEEPTPPIPEEPQPDLSNKEEKVIVQPIKPRSHILRNIIIILILLLALAGAAWYLLSYLKLFGLGGGEQATAEPKQNECMISSADNNDDLTFIQQCLQTTPDTSVLLQLISTAKADNKCNIAQRLYANQAQKNAEIAFTYAKEYDEEFYQANTCFQVDKDTAIYWYETALTLAPDNANSAQAKERLEKLKQ